MSAAVSSHYDHDNDTFSSSSHDPPQGDKGERSFPPVFKVRIVNIDWCMDYPRLKKEHENQTSTTAFLQNRKCPIIRVFGASNSSDRSAKCCAHIHGVLPYFYIDLKEWHEYEEHRPESSEIENYLKRLHNALEYNLKRALSKEPNEPADETNSNERKEGENIENYEDSETILDVPVVPHYIASVQLEPRLQMYGYHSNLHPFARITLFNPLHVSKCAQLLSNGSVLQNAFQPYHVHIPYILQFLVDYKLFGMGWLRLNSYKVRSSRLDTLDHSSKQPREEMGEAESAVDSCFPHRFPLHPSQLLASLTTAGLPPITDADTKLRMISRAYGDDVKEAGTARRAWKREHHVESSLFYKERVTYCKEEIDCWASDIVLDEGEYRTASERLSDASSAEQLPSFMAVSSLAPLWKDEARRRKCNGLSPPELPTDYRRPSTELLYGSKNISPSSQSSQSPSSDKESSQSSVEDMSFLHTLRGDINRQKHGGESTTFGVSHNSMDLFSLSSQNSGIRSSSSEQESNNNDSISIDSQGSVKLDGLHRQRLEELARLDRKALVATKEGSISSKNARQHENSHSSQNLLEGLGKATFKYDTFSPGRGAMSTSAGEKEEEDEDGIEEWRAIATSQKDDDNLEEVEQRAHVSRTRRQTTNSSELYPGAIPRRRKRRKSRQQQMSNDTTSYLTGTEASSTPYPIPNKPPSIIRRRRSLKKTSREGSWLAHRRRRTAPRYEELRESEAIQECPPSTPYYSAKEDVPIHAKYLAGAKEIETCDVFPALPRFFQQRDVLFRDEDSFSMSTKPHQSSGHWIQPCKKPPVYVAPEERSSTAANRQGVNLGNSSQPSLPDEFSREDINQGLTLMSVEIHASASPDKYPNPTKDPLKGIFFVVHDDSYIETSRNTSVRFGRENRYSDHLVPGCILVDANTENLNSIDVLKSASGMTTIEESTMLRSVYGSRKCRCWIVPDEQSLIYSFCWLVRSWDVDILLGFEVQRLSLGFISSRAKVLDLDMEELISRVPSNSSRESRGQTFREWDESHGSGVFICGRTVLNLWRVVKSEVKTNIYHLENMCNLVLKKTVPTYSTYKLDEWWKRSTKRPWTISHLLKRSQLSLELLDELDIIGRASEMARLFGIEFYSVFSRGSQYRVEAVMFRVAKPLNYCLPSPSKEQVARQAAMECLPLVMEPQSRLYTDPVLVLDFQSLYPSVIIGYNICYSTCLGKLKNFEDTSGSTPADKLRNKALGFLHQYDFPVGSIASMEKELYVSPNGVMFAPSSRRRGVLPRMLQEILDTRVMVKESMKYLDQGGVLYKLLNAKQLALKMLANVTYGYTSAGFSGRMPCAEIADAIVQTGRSILDQTIRTIEGTQRWNARVVYGDTDSVFVWLPGRSVESAFRIGDEMVRTITDKYPWPVKLKFEKVYTSSILVSKKRYAGRMMEKPTSVPELDCKGLELVRRDSCPIVADTMQGILDILFHSRDLSKVKQFMQKTWVDIYAGRIRLNKFIFSKEVKMGKYSDRTPLPPSALIAARDLQKDPCAEPVYGERVPYVVIYGSPSARLIDLVVKPEKVVSHDTFLRIHATYYISRAIIPPIQRLLSIVGVDSQRWYAEIGRAAPNWIDLPPQQDGDKEMNRFTISGYYRSCSCVFCCKETHNPICQSCSKFKDHEQNCLMLILNRNERLYFGLRQECMGCSAVHDLEEAATCTSLSCPVYYDRHWLYRRLKNLTQLVGSDE